MISKIAGLLYLNGTKVKKSSLFIFGGHRITSMKTNCFLKGEWELQDKLATPRLLENSTPDAVLLTSW